MKAIDSRHTVQSFAPFDQSVQADVQPSGPLMDADCLRIAHHLEFLNPLAHAHLGDVDVALRIHR